MHRCFKIPEIVREICRHLHTHDPGSNPYWYASSPEKTASSRLALASLSRTCRQFYQPAIEELWSCFSSSYGIDPLLDAIADDLWDFSVVRGERDRSTRFPKREVHYEDIISLKGRASRIRHLCIKVQALSLVPVRSLAAATTPDDGFIFPTLQELRVIGNADLSALVDITPLSIFLSPVISVCRIPVPITNSNTNLSWLTSLARRCPNMTEVDFGNSVAMPYRSVNALFCVLGCLRQLELMIDTVEAMVVLSHLPLLQKLVVIISNSTNLADDAHPLSGGGFPSLEWFRCVSNVDLSPCLFAIALLAKTTPLLFLILEAKRPSPLKIIIDIIEIIPKHMARTLSQWATELLNDPLHLESLADFSVLRILRVEVMTPISIGIQPLEMLAHLDLETLVIEYFEDPACGQCKPKIKLGDLVYILDMFPSLTVLGLPIDATAVPSFSKRPGAGVVVHNEQLFLQVSASPINSAEDVAALLSDIVPELEEITAPQKIVHRTGRRAVENPNYAKWVRAQELVPFLANIREQERNTTPVELSESDEGSES
ncbi:hypothetical protein BKA70DRAFT_1475034 [Coprinopsis sp. MPI-PUGE-AT-0042]|nr:hypothetical protein BKA70DRAFT_1475034 [Coprinopsis sp. MPI-PUGE-AT-0042]